MNDVIKKLQEQNRIPLELPLEGSDETVTIKVKKPSLVKMAKEGQIPNHLLGVANEMITGKPSANKDKKEEEDGVNVAKNYVNMLELYCRATMVEPTYEEVKDYLSDEQMGLIMDFALGGIEELATFRED